MDPTTIALVSALITLINAGIAGAVAVYVGRNWQRTLRNQRFDECLAAMIEVKGLINHCVTLMDKRIEPVRRWDDYNVAWDGWRKFASAWGIASRYRRVPQEPPTRFATVLEEFEAMTASIYNMDQRPTEEQILEKAKQVREAQTKWREELQAIDQQVRSHFPSRRRSN